MTGLTKEQVKLISLGMAIKMRERKLEKKWLSQFQEALFDKERIKAENDYFDYWFELNREQLEDRYMIKRLEDWEEEKDIVEEITCWYWRYIQYCYDKCFENL